MSVLGIDLGVRSIHVATKHGAHSYVVEKSHRSEEIKSLITAFTADYPEWQGYVEEPVVAGARNLRVTIQIAQVCGALLATGDAYLVPVTVWKKEIVGKGNASKDDVHNWLKTRPEYALTGGKQDLVDATCIRMYADKVLGIVDKLKAD